MDAYKAITILITTWLFIGLLVAILRISQLRKHKPEGEISQSDYLSLLPVLVLGIFIWPKSLATVYIDYKNLRYPVKHAMAEMVLACEWLEHAHQHMENGEADKVGAFMLLYAGASRIAKDDLQAVMHHQLPKINGPAAYFPKELGQTDLDHWYDLCHRALALIDEARIWLIERREYYQAYLRLLCSDGAVEQMLEAPKPGPCRFCKGGVLQKAKHVTSKRVKWDRSSGSGLIIEFQMKNIGA